MNLLTQNKKLKRNNIWAFSMMTSYKTCPNAGTCAFYCYVKSGNSSFPSTKNKLIKKYQLTKSPSFINKIQNEIYVKFPKIIRIHVGGDFYSLDYTNKWLAIIRTNPTIQFYAYTKMVLMFEYIKKLDNFPSNFKLIYSFGGLQDKYINIENHPHSKIFCCKKDMKLAGYEDSSKNDIVAIYSQKVGLIYHGLPSIGNKYIK